MRIAAARVLGGRCNPRAIAYLHGAFSRGGPAVRMEVAAALERCGVGTEQLLAHAEEVRRLHALEKLGSTVPSWRAGAARELGLLGRADDIAKITPLLDDRDGSVAAAAAEGLGLAAAQSAAPALQKLAGDEVPVIASAAIEALVELGPEALAGARPVLLRQATSGEAQALPAAAALSMLQDEGAAKSAPATRSARPRGRRSWRRRRRCSRAGVRSRRSGMPWRRR